MATFSFVSDVASCCLDCTTLANVAVYSSEQIRSFRRKETNHVTLRHKSIYIYFVFALQVCFCMTHLRWLIKNAWTYSNYMMYSDRQPRSTYKNDTDIPFVSCFVFARTLGEHSCIISYSEIGVSLKLSDHRVFSLKIIFYCIVCGWWRAN